MPEAAKAGQPPWQHLSGIKRITSEFKHLHRSVQNGQSSQLSNLILVDDEVTQWRFELKNFDDSIVAGHQLNQDLQQLKSQHSQDFLLMEVTFPQAYPQEPPFLRVVSPRCVWYTGHVTAGGAVCLEVLTNTGSANSWRSDYCAESIVQIAIMNMLHCESVMIRTASGGGRSGPLRLDLQHRHCCNVMQPYTMQEAQSAFHRLLRHHQANGWDSTPPDHPHPGHHPPTAPTLSWSGHSTHALTDGAGPSQPVRTNAGQSTFHILAGASQSRHLAFPQSSQHALTNPDQPGQHFRPIFCHDIRRPGANLRPRLSQAAGANSGRDSVTNPSEAQAKGDNTPLIMSQRPVTTSQPSITLSQQPTRDHAGLHNESGINGQQVLDQPAQVDLTNSPDGSNSQQHEGEKGTRGRSQSPLETTVKGNGRQHEGDKGTRNSSCSPQSILEDPSDGADGPDANMRAMCEEVVDLLSPEKQVVDHSAAVSADHDTQQTQASAREELSWAELSQTSCTQLSIPLTPTPSLTCRRKSAQIAAAVEPYTCLTDSLEERHQGMLTVDTMAPAVDMESDTACIDLTENDDMPLDVAPATGAAHASTAAASTSQAPSAAASAEAARVKQLEAQLAQFQAQASKLEAHNLQLASELEKAQQVSQEGARMASLVQPPPFWQAHAQGQAVLYVELPIPAMSDDAVVGTSGNSGDVQLGALHKTWINDMRTNGVELDDALAALRKHKGDEDAALGLVMEASSNGGVMKYLQLIEGLCTVSPPMQPVADACDRELEAETEMVMGWWERHGGLPRSRITSIRRVQNQPLWTKYALKRAEIQEARADSHETWLFHGANKSCIELIAAKGFDIRVSRHGMLGQGTYFANCSAYSDKYARMGPERAVGAGFASSSGMGSYRSMLGMQYHQLRAQRQQQHLQQQQQQQQQQQHQQPQQAKPFSVDPSGMSGRHAFLLPGPPQLWPGNAPVKSAAQAASEADAQATAAAVHLRGPAAYNYPFQITAADTADRLPHGIANQVQQQREQQHQAKCVIAPAAEANAGSADRPQSSAAAEGTGATSDVAFPGNMAELRQHCSRQIPPRQISEVPAASAAVAAQPDQFDNTHPGSSAGVGVPIPGHLPNSGLADQDETDRARIRKRYCLRQWEAASTSASQHVRFSEGTQLSASFKPPRPLSQGSDEPLNAQPQGKVGHPKGPGAMPPPAPRQSADRATERRQSLQDVPASSQHSVSRSRALVERSRQNKMLSLLDDPIDGQSSRLQKARQPPFASDQQPIGESCNKGPAGRALNDGAGSTHTAEGARALRRSCDTQDGDPNPSHMLPTCSSAPLPDPDPAPVMSDSLTTGQTALPAQESGRQPHTAQTDLDPSTLMFAGLLPYSDPHCRQAHVTARKRHSRQSDLAQPRPDEETQLATTHRRPRDKNSHTVPDNATADLDQGRLRHEPGLDQGRLRHESALDQGRLTHGQGVEQNNRACHGEHQGGSQGGSSLPLVDMAPQHQGGSHGGSSPPLVDMPPQHWQLPKTTAAAADAAMVEGAEEDKRQQPAQSAPASRAGKRVCFADTATVGESDDTAFTQQQQLLPEQTHAQPLSLSQRLAHDAAAKLQHVSQGSGNALGHVRSRRPFTRGQADARTDMLLSASDEPALPPAAGSRRPYSRPSAVPTAAAGEAASGKVTKDAPRDESQGYPVNPLERESGRPSKRRKLNSDDPQANWQRGDMLSQLKQEGHSRPERHANGIPGMDHDSNSHGQVKGQAQVADGQDKGHQKMLQRLNGHQAIAHQANGQNDGQGQLAEHQTNGLDHRGDGQGHKRGSRQGHKGKGSPSQTADSNGPAGAILLGSSLDPAANEVNSKAAADHSLPSSGALSPFQPLKPFTGSGPNLASGGTHITDRHSEAESLTMLLSRVALGKTVKGSSDLRRPPDGFDACFHGHRGHTEIFCVYDNAQAYPEYIVTYKGARNAAG